MSTETTASRQCECGNTTIVTIDKNNPTGIMTVTGEYSLWGFKGYIELEYTIAGSKFIITTRKYNFTGSLGDKDPRFEILTHSGPILAIVPVRNAGWVNWPSSAETNYYSPGMAVVFDFRFHIDHGGNPLSDRKVIVFR
ncbi:hypothetical protein SAMN04490207_3950 [Pseudomonas gessardii]|jgi:hypothetical protein|uniref:Uncharacterized protein n=1 Tax=Pseudomonas gessardii TaxID=78544 RepID=A0A7Y1QLB7_9PSED|nr:hypothetical protein [Pseudomonas gessardii]MRU52071.1 hypothetical protein [Pseudomonas gessardii]NNA95372.1 hypothetical protein [Pseudomonas gessardii]SDR20672.1 hypothetical protein SAMN04490207_3950 [Pseudomonas gessardii]